MDYLSKSSSAVHIGVFIETPNAIKKEESYLQEQKGFNADEILKIEQEAEILREQVETLKQELQYECQLGEQYQQEIVCTNLEMSIINRELQEVHRLEKLKLDEAKRLAQNLLFNHKSTSESLAELLSAIYDVSVTAEQLKPIKN